MNICHLFNKICISEYPQCPCDPFFLLNHMEKMNNNIKSGIIFLHYLSCEIKSMLQFTRKITLLSTVIVPVNTIRNR